MIGSNSKPQALTNPGSSNYTRPAMPETMSQFSYDEVRQAWNAFSESQVAHHTYRLGEVLDSNEVLSQWEIDQLQKVFDKFSAKYTSPLAKALK